MKISKLIETLKKQQELVGDIEVTIQATTLGDGYSSSGTVTDVFESTVESVKVYTDKYPRLRLFWQT